MTKKSTVYSAFNAKLVTDLEPEILKQAHQIFFKQASKEMQILLNASKKKDFDCIQLITHKLKGSSISVGFEAFSKQSSKIEKKLLNKNKKIIKDTYILYTMYNEIKKLYSF